jgi:hypothetical protein
LHQELHTHLAMGPEIARPARDTFYRFNVFKFELIGTIRFPQLAVRNLITKVQLTVFLFKGSWRLLKKFVTQEHGFDHLQHLTLVFKRSNCPIPRVSRLRMKPPGGQIVFDCAGTIEFVDDISLPPSGRYISSARWKRCEASVREMIFLAK